MKIIQYSVGFIIYTFIFLSAIASLVLPIAILGIVIKYLMGG